MPQPETLANLETVIQEILVTILWHLDPIAVGLPVVSSSHKSRVYVRSNERFRPSIGLSPAIARHMNVQFIVYDAFLDEGGRLRPDYTTDGLHLTIAGYAALSRALQETLWR